MRKVATRVWHHSFSPSDVYSAGRYLGTTVPPICYCDRDRFLCVVRYSCCGPTEKVFRGASATSSTYFTLHPPNSAPLLCITEDLEGLSSSSHARSCRNTSQRLDAEAFRLFAFSRRCSCLSLRGGKETLVSFYIYETVPRDPNAPASATPCFGGSGRLLPTVILWMIYYLPAAHAARG